MGQGMSCCVEEGSKTVTTEEKVVVGEKADNGEDKPKTPEPAGPNVTVKVVSCRGLRNADWSWTQDENVSDAYVIAKVGDKEILRTDPIMNSLEPVFDVEFPCPRPIFDSPADITFEVFDKDPIKPDDRLGTATMKRENFMDHGFNGEIEIVDAKNLNKAYIKVMVKLPGSEYPAGPEAEFKVTIKKKKANTPIGFEVDKHDPMYLFIVTDGSKFEGAAKEYNAAQESWTTQLRKMQSIFAVNSVSGDATKMEAELKKAQEVTLTIRRPHVWTIAVEKKEKFGVTMVDAATSVLVKDIKDGPLKVWNENHAAKEVKVGDRVIEVNGKVGKGRDLLDMIAKTEGKKQIVFLRPAEPGVLTALWHSWF